MSDYISEFSTSFHLSLTTTALLVIDAKTSELKHWKGLDPDVLGQFGIYKIWRVNRRKLQDRAIELIVNGVRPNWRLPKPERF